MSQNCRCAYIPGKWIKSWNQVISAGTKMHCATQNTTVLTGQSHTVASPSVEAFIRSIVEYLSLVRNLLKLWSMLWWRETHKMEFEDSIFRALHLQMKSFKFRVSLIFDTAQQIFDKQNAVWLMLWFCRIVRDSENAQKPHDKSFVILFRAACQ